MNSSLSAEFFMQKIWFGALKPILSSVQKVNSIAQNDFDANSLIPMSLARSP